MRLLLKRIHLIHSVSFLMSKEYSLFSHLLAADYLREGYTQRVEVMNMMIAMISVIKAILKTQIQRNNSYRRLRELKIYHACLYYLKKYFSIPIQKLLVAQTQHAVIHLACSNWENLQEEKPLNK